MGGGGIGAHSQGRDGVCGRHREHIFCSPANFLGDQHRGSRNLQHCLDSPPPEGEVLLLGMRDVVICVPTPRVSHPFDVERGAGLASRHYRRHGELNARQACLTGDEPHCSRMTEEAPTPIQVGVVIGHVV